MKVAASIVILFAATLQQAQQRAQPAALTMPQLAGAQAPAQVAPPQLPAAQLAQTQLPQFNTRADFKVFEPTDLRQLLSLLAQANGLNLAMAPGITETVDRLDLSMVTLKDALDAIVIPRGLLYQIDGGLLKITRPQMEDRTFKFDYVLMTQRTLGRSLSANANAGVGGASGGAGGSLGGGSSTSLSGTETTNLLKDITDALTALKSPGGRVTITPMAGAIFVRDLPENLAAIEHYLEVVQTAVNRQVIIEAKFVEVTLNKDSETGVNWALINRTLNVTQTLASPGPFQVALAVGDFNLLISALRSQGKVNIFSAPTISTVNNQAAVIRVGTQDPFFTETRQIDRTTGAIVSTSETVSTINEGVVLDVTPSISDDGIIYMAIHPTVSERTGEKTSAQGNTVPITNVQEADTIVRVTNGETAVIAGLISSRMIEQESKVPLAGDIPFLGALFRSTSRELRKTDLIILLTPRIVTVASAPAYTKQRLDAQENLRLEDK